MSLQHHKETHLFERDPPFVGLTFFRLAQGNKGQSRWLKQLNVLLLYEV